MPSSALSKPAKLSTRLSSILVDAPASGGPLRWGLAAAIGGAVDDRRIWLSELGCGNPLPKRLRAVEIAAELDAQLHQLDRLNTAPTIPLSDAIDATLWAYALPELLNRIGDSQIATLSDSLLSFSRRCASLADHSVLARLVGGGELGLVLAWRLGEKIDKEFVDHAALCLKQWCDAPEPSIGLAVHGGFGDSTDDVPWDHERRGSHARLVLASVVRGRALAAKVAKLKLKKNQLNTLSDFATWIAAATRVGGTAAMSTATARDVRDDTITGGLLDHAKMFDPETLGPAIDAASGKVKSGGKLAWQISLPESFWHSELGGTAIFLPEWDVRRGRMHLDYSGEDVRLQIDSGKLPVVDGPWELLIQVDDQEQAAAAPWTSSCEFSDDDVHYLELEQRWTGGIKVQRHMLLIREDRCVLLADAVTRDPSLPPAKIAYTSRLKIAADAVAESEKDTTEVWFLDERGKQRGLALSLQSNEWRVGPTSAKLGTTADGNLRLEVHSGKQIAHGGSLFAPLWFDFQQRRFTRPRTWRQLSVAENLRLVDADESVAFRVQHGSEQWIVYRMLNGDSPRSFIGKHILADFFCARFHASDGNLEDLVTVGGDEDE